MRTIGLDVHKRFAEVAILDQGERVVRRGERIDATASALRAFARTLGPDDQVVLEATVNTWAIADLLRERAGRVVVSNPMRTRAIADAKVKTDRIDAAVLAQLLAADFLPEVWTPDEATRGRRRQVAHRSSLLQQRTRLRNRVQAILHRNLLDCPFSDAFGKGGRRWLAEAALPTGERGQVESALRLLDALEAEVAIADTEVAEETLGDERVQRLMTIPGVGATTAFALVAVIGDVGRFPRPNQLVGYLGLDPRVRQSGDRPAHTGHISRQGQAHARGLLVEAAHSAIRTPGPLRAFHERTRARRGPQIAAVAVARKLAILAWHLLHSGTEYRWAPSGLTAAKLRRLELTAGAPRRRGGWDARATDAERQIHSRQSAEERRALAQAEEAYRALVAGRRHQEDAAAANGERLCGAKPDARRRSHPHPPHFSTGSDRVPDQASASS
jgi:transposase